MGIGFQEPGRYIFYDAISQLFFNLIKNESTPNQRCCFYLLFRAITKMRRVAHPSATLLIGVQGVGDICKNLVLIIILVGFTTRLIVATATSAFVGIDLNALHA